MLMDVDGKISYFTRMAHFLDQKSRRQKTPFRIQTGILGPDPILVVVGSLEEIGTWRHQKNPTDVLLLSFSWGEQ